MNGFIIVADAAKCHPDGTFSLLRGGIDKIQVPRDEPILFRGATLFRVKGGPDEAGNHSFRFRLLGDREGNAEGVLPDVNGSFNLAPEGGNVTGALDFQARLPDYGVYVFEFKVDGETLDTWRIRVVERPQERQT